MVQFDSFAVEEVAKKVLRWPSHRMWNANDKHRKFRSIFGASSGVVADIWNRIVEKNAGDFDQPGAEPKHLLWALVFLKCYSTEEIHCALVGWPSTNTFRKWSWYFVKKIKDLKYDVIKLSKRFDGYGKRVNSNCFISVDGTDCETYEPWPFKKDMYSQKSNGPGLKYEVAVCIKTGHIVWIAGPFPASASDGTIFKNGLTKELCDDEVVEVDRGYKGDGKMMRPEMGIDSKERKMKSNSRAQHDVLSSYFRHCKEGRTRMMTKYGWCFDAVAVINQLKIEAGEPIFKEELEYSASYF